MLKSLEGSKRANLELEPFFTVYRDSIARLLAMDTSDTYLHPLQYQVYQPSSVSVPAFVYWSPLSFLTN